MVAQNTLYMKTDMYVSLDVFEINEIYYRDRCYVAKGNCVNIPICHDPLVHLALALYNVAVT